MLDKAPYARLKIGTISDYKGVADNATVPYGEVNETSTRLACMNMLANIGGVLCPLLTWAKAQYPPSVRSRDGTHNTPAGLMLT